jgi:hypothetical protein
MNNLISKLQKLVLPACVALLFVLIFSGSSVHAQSEDSWASITSASVSIAENPGATLHLTAQVYDGVVYLHLHVTGQNENSIFVFEKAVNGEEYLVVQMKDGYPTPNDSVVIVYCAKDTSPNQGTSLYRVNQIKNSGPALTEPVAVFIMNAMQFAAHTQSNLLLARD